MWNGGTLGGSLGFRVTVWGLEFGVWGLASRGSWVHSIRSARRDFHGGHGSWVELGGSFM